MWKGMFREGWRQQIELISIPPTQCNLTFILGLIKSDGLQET